ncbi:hypothetical protein [Mycolicibacterium sp.]|uniref:hypothetical protein n=1 Tax=Mycolicibacterium sp. TaxID=2320850 RepID=UPI00356107BD
MTGAVDEFVTALAPEVRAPGVRRRDVVLVTGPWLAGSTSVARLLADRRPDVEFVEADELGPGEVPVAVVFVASAAAPLTRSDCAVLDLAAAHTDVVICALTKVDAHRNWSEVLDADRETLAAHAPRYARVPWVAVAAAPDLGAPRCEDLLTELDAALSDDTVSRRNRLRAWEFRLQSTADQYDIAADGAGREARVEALRTERAEALRGVRVGRSERAVALRSQIQQARVQLSYFARNRCTSVRTELQEDAGAVNRRGLPEYLAFVERRIGTVVNEVDTGITEHLTDLAAELGLPADPGATPMASQPGVGPPPLKSRRLETRLTVLVGAGFGLGIALTLSRLFADLAPGLTALGAVVCLLLGAAVAVWMVNTRSLLHDRAVLDRWIGERTAGLRAALDQTVATRVLAAEMSMTSALSQQAEADQVRVAEQVRTIDAELRAHEAAGAQARAARDAAAPTLGAALAAVRAELGDPDPGSEHNGRSVTEDAEAGTEAVAGHGSESD